jgi:N utilization substance protein A
VQTVIAELGGEKIDIIEWDDNPVRFITNSLAPAKIMSVQINEKEKHALVEVAEDQLSLAIGKEGQNVRLAVKLTDWKIDIIKEDGEKVAGEGKKKDLEDKENEKEAKAEEKDDEKKSTSENTEESEDTEKKSKEEKDKKDIK